MSNNRKKVPLNTETNVLVLSRRRCALCFGLHRDATVKKGQVAHLDKNPANNILDNLVYLCLDHHDEYDSRTSQTKSLRLPEVQRYREELYRYLNPENTLPIPEELRRTVLIELSLIPHEWKNDYMTLYPGHFSEGSFKRKREYVDVWDMMIDVAYHSYAEGEWKRYHSLFSVGIPHVIERIERILTAYGDVISSAMKLVALRATSRLRFEMRSYTLVKDLVTYDPDLNVIFPQIFRNVLTILGEISRSASNE